MPHHFKNKMLLFLSGHRDSFSIAVCYHNGNVVDKDINTALFFYKEAALAGHVLAYLQMGLIQEQLGKNEQAIKSYYAAACRKNKDAKSHLLRLALQHALAEYYLGVLFEQNNEWQKALESYQKAAEKGFAPSFYRLGQLYQQDRVHTTRRTRQVIISKHSETELAFYRKGALLGCKYSLDALLTVSATQARAAFFLAEFYMQGTAGLAKNVERAEHYYRKASDLGSVEAALVLGNLYEQGNSKIKINLASAYNYYLIAAKSLNSSAKASAERLLIKLNDRKLFLAYSKICKQTFHDISAAVRWYRKAAEENTKEGAIDCEDPDLLYSVAESYQQEGDIPFAQTNALKYYQAALKKNSSEALKALQLLADQDDSEAQYILAEYMHEKNKILEATHLCMRAGKKQHEKALHYLMETKFSVEVYLDLANCYDYGKNVSKNIDYAVKFYSDATQLGSIKAVLRLGQLHLIDHLGKPKDLHSAWRYFMQAAASGNKEALLTLNRLAEDMESMQQLELARLY